MFPYIPACVPPARSVKRLTKSSNVMHINNKPTFLYIAVARMLLSITLAHPEQSWMQITRPSKVVNKNMPWVRGLAYAVIRNKQNEAMYILLWIDPTPRNACLYTSSKNKNPLRMESCKETKLGGWQYLYARRMPAANRLRGEGGGRTKNEVQNKDSISSGSVCLTCDPVPSTEEVPTQPRQSAHPAFAHFSS